MVTVLKEKNYKDVNSDDWRDVASRFKGQSFKEAPKNIEGVARMEEDLIALSNLMGKETPHRRMIRGSGLIEVIYGFRDASGTDFRLSWKRMNKASGVDFRVGVWNEEVSKNSSNFRELANLVESMEELGRRGSLAGKEILLFTDNTTCEEVFYKGNASSKLLFELVLRLRILALHQKMKVHVIHVSGTRMIAQGTDGLSRGEMLEGVIDGDPMLKHIPLHLLAVQRSPKLISCIKLWLGEEASLLKNEEWYDKGHGIDGGVWSEDGLWWPQEKKGRWIWEPPPAAAEVAVEQLRVARMNWIDSTHLFVCPKLMTPRWRRQLFKVSDLVLVCPVGEAF